jgi:hypothetical protein
MWSMQQPLGLRVLVLRAARCTPSDCAVAARMQARGQGCAATAAAATTDVATAATAAGCHSLLPRWSDWPVAVTDHRGPTSFATSRRPVVATAIIARASAARRSASSVNTTGTPPRLSIYVLSTIAIGQPALTHLHHLARASPWTGCLRYRARRHLPPKPPPCPCRCRAYLASRASLASRAPSSLIFAIPMWSLAPHPSAPCSCSGPCRVH